MTRLVALGLCFLSSWAVAQDNPTPAPPAASHPETPTPVEVAPAAEQATTSPAPTPGAATSPGGTNLPPVSASPPAVPAFTRMSGRWGFGFLGSMATPGFASDATGQLLTLGIPVLGVRHWSRWSAGPARFGAELGVGLSISTGTVERGVPNGTMETLAGIVGWCVHLGLPVGFAAGDHVLLFAAPELRYARSTEDGGSSVPLDVPASSSRVVTDFSLRAGAEVFFSFVGLPNLSLEGSVRLTARWVYSSTSTNIGFGFINQYFTLNTSLVSNPWDLFTGSIAAKYYF